MSVIAAVFPGQGSQSVGMLSDVAAENPSILNCFEQASAALGYDLWQLIQADPDGTLNQTHITQPALLTASVALWELARQRGFQPNYLAGHSLGEYSALVCAKTLNLQDAVKLVEARGQLMQKAVPAGEGAMYAIIGLADNEIQNVCQRVADQTNEIVAPVNYNSPGQVVIAGTSKAVALAGAACKEAGAKRALPLAVSVPSHCMLMKTAADELKSMLDKITFSSPQIPVVNNVDVAIETDPAQIKDALVRQLYMPVRWTESIQLLVNKSVETVYEVGPGKVLSGLIKRIDKSVTARVLNSPADFETLV